VKSAQFHSSGVQFRCHDPHTRTNNGFSASGFPARWSPTRTLAPNCLRGQHGFTSAVCAFILPRGIRRSRY
jgi:hypothetical protein